MASPLAAIERFFERLFERPAARLFNTGLQPIQLQRRVERAMEAERRMSADRIYVPNRFRVLLSADDYAGFERFRASLERDLADAVLARARQRRYSLVERPRVVLEPSEEVTEGDILVHAEVSDSAAAPSPPGFRPMAPGVAAPGAPPPVVTEDPRGQELMSRTAVFPVPQAPVPRAAIVVRAPGQGIARVPVRAGTMRIGRSDDNDLALSDDRISRYHGQLAIRQGILVYTDLGSTNGSWVNGSRVSEIALGPGDVVQLGDSTLTVEAGS